MHAKLNVFTKITKKRSLSYLVGRVGNGKDVRRQVAEPPVLVQLNILWIVDGEEGERVDGNENGADVGVDVALLEAGLDGGGGK